MFLLIFYNSCFIILFLSCRPVTLVVAKCWDPSPKGYLMAPRQEPVRPIDPSAWVAHTEAVQAMYGRLGPPPSVIGVASTGPPGSMMCSIPESTCEYCTGSRHTSKCISVLFVYSFVFLLCIPILFNLNKYQFWVICYFSLKKGKTSSDCLWSSHCYSSCLSSILTLVLFAN